MSIEGSPEQPIKIQPERDRQEASRTNNQLPHLVEMRDRFFLNRYHPDALAELIRYFLPDENPTTVNTIVRVSNRVFQTLEIAIEDSSKPH